MKKEEIRIITIGTMTAIGITTVFLLGIPLYAFVGEALYKVINNQ